MAAIDPASVGFRRLGEDVRIYEMTTVIGPEQVALGSHVLIDDFVMLQGGRGLEIGSYVHIASFASVTGGGPTRIGDFATLASGVRVLTGTDVVDGSSLANSSIPDRFRTVERPGATVEDFAFLGANAVVLPGIVVGEGAVAGAGAVVVEDLEPWTIYVGVPARKLRRRPSRQILAWAAELGYPFDEGSAAAEAAGG
jgi:acetyltransferase-like isoleucine patch superfamily enzyme